MTASSTSIADSFRQRKYEFEQVTSTAAGYTVTGMARDHVFSMARCVINAFDGDPEAGDPTIEIAAQTDGTFELRLTIKGAP